SRRAAGCHSFCNPHCLGSIYRKLQHNPQSRIGIGYSSFMAKSYLFHRTNINFATPCVVHKKMLFLMASVCAFFVSTKVVPVFHFASLQSKLSTSSLAQLAVGSRRFIHHHSVSL